MEETKKSVHQGSFKKGFDSRRTGFKVGHPPFFKQHTEESKRKLSLALKGKPKSAEHVENSRRGHLGQVAWNKGKTASDETRKKQSLARIGKSPWNKGKVYPQIKGENNPAWKGGITPINKIIRHSIAYRLWREAVFTRDNFTCIWCGQIGGMLNADHIKPFSMFPELRLAIDNGRTLCESCHKKTDTFGGESWKK